MIQFLIASSYFIVFLGIFLSQENILLTFCVQLLGAPSIYQRVPSAGVCVPCCVGDGWG
jgi:hypothetical protein